MHLLLLLACEPNEADRQLTARQLVGQKRFEQAWQELEGIEPLNADGLLAKGVLLGEDGDDEGALKAFTAGLEMAPMPELYTNDCIVRLRLERDALAACKEAVLQAPTDPRAAVGLAEAAARDGSGEAAKEALFTASDLVGDDLETMAWMAEVWAALDEQEAACMWGVRSAVDTNVTARACLFAGRGGDAVAMLERIADPEACSLLFTLSVDESERLMAGPQRQKAIGRAERWERCTIVGGAAYLTDKGRLLLLQGDRLGAEASWREAMGLAPEEIAPRLNLIRSLLSRNQPEGDELLTTASNLHTATGLVFSLETVAIRRRGGELDDALAEGLKVVEGCQFVKSDACLAEARFELARCSALAGEIEASLEHLKGAVEAGGAPIQRRIANEPDLRALQNELAYYDLVNSGP